MNLSIKYNLPQKDWDAFVAKEASDGGFLQSWQWGEFQQGLGKLIFRLAVADGDKIIAATLVIKHVMPLGFSYLYLPRGPVMAEKNIKPEILEYLFIAINKISQTEQAIFLRLDPPWTSDVELIKSGFSSIGSVQPASTLILDLNKTEDELLTQMKPKTRYNIKVAQKHQLKIVESNKSEEDFEEFWKLLEKTSERDKIKSHGKAYYKKMLELPAVRLVFIKDGDNFAAGNIMIRFGVWEIYLHGASDYDYRDKMGPYLLQWQMFLNAKKSGCKYYDFWGADESKWPGVTRFKQGFSPKQSLTKYIGAYDLPYKKFIYKLYSLSKKYVR